MRPAMRKGTIFKVKIYLLFFNFQLLVRQKIQILALFRYNLEQARLMNAPHGFSNASIVLDLDQVQLDFQYYKNLIILPVLYAFSVLSASWYSPICFRVSVTSLQVMALSLVLSQRSDISTMHSSGRKLENPFKIS